MTVHLSFHNVLLITVALIKSLILELIELRRKKDLCLKTKCFKHNLNLFMIIC